MIGTPPDNWWGDGGIVSTWQDLIRLEEQFSRSLKTEWVFRGHSSASYRLATTLERAFRDLAITADRSILERALIVEFKRYYHLYGATAAPKEDDTLAYVALMRHYGAPTRLLDFTFSLFIATYFAVEFADGPSAIWAVNKTWLTKAAHAIILRSANGNDLLEELGARKGHAFEQVYLNNCTGQAFVGPVGPSFMNDRQAVQQGLFFCPTDLTKSFDSILGSMADSQDNVQMIKIASEATRELLIKSQRANISRAGLFPGLAGFAESLRTKLLLFERMQRMTEVGGRVGPNITGV